MKSRLSIRPLVHSVWVLACAFSIWGGEIKQGVGAEPVLTFRSGAGEVELLADGERVFAYVFEDSKTPRPYFTHVRLPGGPQLTRNHPPQEGDSQDHDLMHPGIWFALGDLNGQDNWRLKAKVAGGEFLERPVVHQGRGTFTVRNQYLSNDGKEVLMTEECRYEFIPRQTGLLMTIDSRMTGNVDCRFGDGMEEMGLGVRVATPLAVKSGKGGSIVDSDGRTGEKETRERLSEWCDYNGVIDGRKVGITIFAGPENPRKVWWHTRDYGFFTANPFHAHVERSDNTPLVLKKGETVRFRFGVALHGDGIGGTYQPGEEYRVYLKSLEKE